MKFDQKKLDKIFNQFSKKKILVIGDVMVDAYFWGKTERISPEAPVPIIEVDDTNYNPGGAGNVALNLSTLGAQVSIVSLIGKDSNANILLNLLESNGIDISGILQVDDFNTPIKTRVIAQDQQVIRIDQEKNNINIDSRLSEIKSIIKKNIEAFDGIVIADYNKGLLSKKVIEFILDIAANNEIPIYVDPKISNFFEYKKVRLFKPNILEFQIALKNDFSIESINEHGKKFKEENEPELLLITRGADDAIIFYEDAILDIPTVTQSVHDVSGAGDTVIATFTLADVCGADPIVAANLANIAASIVCSKVGVVPIHLDELRAQLIN